MLAGCQIPAIPAARSLEGRSSVEAGSGFTAPFASALVESPGSGQWFRRGTTERRVLKSKAELEAFITRHERFVPPPNPVVPAPEPQPLPQPLLEIDFSRNQAIVFFDGEVKVGATSRITAVQDLGDRYLVQTTRWEPPPNPKSADDANGRVHLIVLPRTDRPIEFAPLVLNQDVAQENEGGFSAGGNPMMNPRWRAVPNPEVTRERLETQLRAQHGQSMVERFSLEKRTIQWVQEHYGDQFGRGGNFTMDSEVWVAELGGSLEWAAGGHMGIPGTVGAGEPRASQMVMLISIEDGRMFESLTKAAPREPGMRFTLLPDGDLFIGDTLRFDVQGQPVEGSLQLTVRAGATGKELSKTIAYGDLATFQLALDQANVPGLTNDPVQKLTITFQYGNTTGQREVHLIRDRDVQPTPLLRAGGPGNAGEFGAPASAEALEAFALEIAKTDWKGENVAVTSRAMTKAELNLDPIRASTIPDTVSLREFELRGRYPKYLIPDSVSGTGKAEVMAPTRVVVVLSESTPIQVVSMKAYP